MGQAWSGGRGSTIAEAAIREVETAAGNAQAESARTAGGRMNVETQRGSNGLHGQVFLFDRENNWGARNPFTQWVRETAPGTDITVPTFYAGAVYPSGSRDGVGHRPGQPDTAQQTLLVRGAGQL